MQKGLKPPKPLKNAHTPNTQFGMGDYYGSGVRAKIGKMREDSIGMFVTPPSKLKKPPKSLA